MNNIQQQISDYLSSLSTFVEPVNENINISCLSKFSERTKISLPTIYKDFLLVMNGCNIFQFEDHFENYGLSLFGLPELENHTKIPRNIKEWVFNWYNGIIEKKYDNFIDFIINETNKAKEFYLLKERVPF